MKKQHDWNRYIKDLDKLYKLAMKEDNIALALKVKESQIKLLQHEMKNIQSFDLSELSDAHIDHVIACIEHKMHAYTQNSDKETD